MCAELNGKGPDADTQRKKESNLLTSFEIHCDRPDFSASLR